MAIDYKKERKERKERKETRKQDFPFQQEGFFWKSGTGSRHKSGEDQVLKKRGKTPKAEEEIQERKGGFSEGTFNTHRENVGKEIHPGEGNWKREAGFTSLEKF